MKKFETTGLNFYLHVWSYPWHSYVSFRSFGATGNWNMAIPLLWLFAFTTVVPYKPWCIHVHTVTNIHATHACKHHKFLQKYLQQYRTQRKLQHFLKKFSKNFH